MYTHTHTRVYGDIYIYISGYIAVIYIYITAKKK